MKKLVSIILATHNDPPYLTRAMQSVLAQSFSDWELIVVDDGLVFKAREVAENFAATDPRIIIVTNSRNLGLQKSLNAGLSAARGKYIARLDDDDEWPDPAKLEKQIEFLENNPEYVLVGTGAIIVDQYGGKLMRYLPPATDLSIRRKILSKNCFVHSSVVFVTEVVSKLGGYAESEGTKHVEDYDLWLRLGQSGKMYNLSIYATLLTTSESNISVRNKLEQLKKCAKISRIYQNAYPNSYIAFIKNYLRIWAYNLLGHVPSSGFKHKLVRLYRNWW